jgi:hypothetical protein
MTTPDPDIWTNALPAVAYTSLELHDGADFKCGAGPFLVHRGGLEITTNVLVSPELAQRDPESWLGNFAQRVPGVEIGFRLRGSMWTQWHWQGSEDPKGKSPLQVTYRGGRGTPTGARHEWRATPLLLDQELDMACRWRPRDIEGEWVPVDMAALRDALERVERFSSF